MRAATQPMARPSKVPGRIRKGMIIVPRMTASRFFQKSAKRRMEASEVPRKPAKTDDGSTRVSDAARATEPCDEKKRNLPVKKRKNKIDEKAGVEEPTPLGDWFADALKIGAHQNADHDGEEISQQQHEKAPMLLKKVGPNTGMKLLWKVDLD